MAWKGSGPTKSKPPVIGPKEGRKMRRIRLLLLGVLLALPIVGTATTAHACTSQFDPDGCEVVNRVCQRLGGKNCLG